MRNSETLTAGEPLTNPQRVVKALSEMMSEFDREMVGVINLKSNMEPINVHFASIGSINEALIRPAEIYKAAILSNAANIILIHNHPSGNLTPSIEDTRMTDRMIQVGELMGIPLRDHIIVGGMGDNYFSFAEKNLISFEELKLKENYQDLSLTGMRDNGKLKESGRYGKTKEERKEAVDEITQKLEKGLQELFDSDKFKTYLRTMAKFHNYSFNNTLLIAMQKPDATLVAGYQSWRKKFERTVMKDEKGIKILAPVSYKKQVKKEIVDPQTRKPILDSNGKPLTEMVEITVPAFKPVTVFDVSSTTGKELPALGTDELRFSIDRFAVFMKALEKISPVPIEYADIESGAKGYFSQNEQRIVIQKGMSEAQTVKTAVHEICHALLDDKAHVRMEGMESDNRTRSDKEVTAEAVAYTVSSAMFDMDTSEYSFAYIAGWSTGKDMAELKESMETIRKTSDHMIMQLEDALHMIQLEQVIEKETVESISQSENLILAAKIDNFLYDFDPYEYADHVEDRVTQIKQVSEDLKHGDTEYLITYLTNIIEQEAGTDADQKLAKELIGEMQNYQQETQLVQVKVKTAKEESNFEKTSERQSLRKRLEDKKVQVAVSQKKPEQEKHKVNGRGVIGRND